MSGGLGALGALSSQYSDSEQDDEEVETKVDLNSISFVDTLSTSISLDLADPRDQVMVKVEPGEGLVNGIKIEKDLDLDQESSNLLPNPSFTTFRNPVAAPLKQNYETEDSDSSSSSSDDADADADQSTTSNKSKTKSRRKKKTKNTKKLTPGVDPDQENDADSSSSFEEEYDLSAEEGGRKKEPPRVKGELRYCDLPPIEDLHISVPRDKAKPIGVIKSVVDPLVIVEAYPSTPALDLDSVLFLEEGDRSLGRVFDVMGPVQRPWYVIRFNDLSHIESNDIVVGARVYCAPATPHTSYVLVAQLQKLKGTDASWLDDVEPPPEAQEFSDDEAEREMKKKKRQRKPRANPHQQEVGGGVNGVPMGPGPPRYSNPHYRGRGRGRGGFNQNPMGHQQNYPQQHYRGPPPPRPYSSQQQYGGNYSGNSYYGQEYSWHTHPAASPMCPPFNPQPHPQFYQQHPRYSNPTPWPHPLVQQESYRAGPPPPPPPRDHGPSLPVPPGT